MFKYRVAFKFEDRDLVDIVFSNTENEARLFIIKKFNNCRIIRVASIPELKVLPKIIFVDFKTKKKLGELVELINNKGDEYDNTIA